MELAELVKEKRGEILRIANEHGAYNVRVFGSVSRGEAGPESDVDFLVDWEPNRSLLDMSGLTLDLQDSLGRRVDVAEPKSLHRVIREQVLREAVPL